MTFCSLEVLGCMGRDVNFIFPAQANKNSHVLIRYRQEIDDKFKKVIKEYAIRTMYKVGQY